MVGQGWLERAERHVTALLLMGAALLSAAQVAERYGVRVPASAFEEVSIYLLIGVVFIGMLRADRTSQHISLDLLYQVLPPRAKRVCARLRDAVLATVAGLMAWLSVKAVLFSYDIGERSISMLSVPIWLASLVMPVGFVVLTVMAARRAIAGRSLPPDEVLLTL
jgi:TRAP-type C4-dicarboxylate transport system permease small subunit